MRPLFLEAHFDLDLDGPLWPLFLDLDLDRPLWPLFLDLDLDRPLLLDRERDLLRCFGHLVLDIDLEQGIVLILGDLDLLLQRIKVSLSPQDGRSLHGSPNPNLGRGTHPVHRVTLVLDLDLEHDRGTNPLLDLHREALLHLFLLLSFVHGHDSDDELDDELELELDLFLFHFRSFLYIFFKCFFFDLDLDLEEEEEEEDEELELDDLEESPYITMPLGLRHRRIGEQDWSHVALHFALREVG